MSHYPDSMAFNRGPYAPEVMIGARDAETIAHLEAVKRQTLALMDLIAGIDPDHLAVDFHRTRLNELCDEAAFGIGAIESGSGEEYEG